LRDRAAEILPVPYCHVVFTLPRELAPSEKIESTETERQQSAGRGPRLFERPHEQRLGALLPLGNHPCAHLYRRYLR